MCKIVKKSKVDARTIKEWKRLWRISKNKNYFNSFDWFKNYISIFSLKKYIILKGYCDGKLQFILPLEKISYKKWKCIGDKYLDKVSFLYRNNFKSCIKSLKEYARKNKISIILYECDFDGVLLDKKDCIIEFASENPYINLTQDINKVIKNKEQRYIENIIKKNKELSFKILKGKDTNKYIEKIFDIESRSNKIKRKRAIFVDEKCKEIFRNISKTEYGMLCILYYDDIPIAHMYGLIASFHKFMAYHMAYDKDYSKFQPGKLVIYYLLKCLKEDAYQIFDFSRGNSILKKHFSAECSINYNVYINPDICIKLYLTCIKLVIFLKKAIKKVLKEIGIWKK